MMRKTSIYILLLSVLMASCTDENLEDCSSGLRLRFHFTLHEEPSKGNLFGQNVEYLKVYVFDQEGVLQHIAVEKGAILTNNYVMSLDLEPGRYSIVAWASDNEGEPQSHSDKVVVDITQSVPLYRELEIGKSNISELGVILDTKTATDGFRQPLTDAFDDLYYGAVGKRSGDGKSIYTIIPVDVVPAKVVERDVEMIRNTNIVRITIEGLDKVISGVVVPEDELTVSMSGTNYQYRFDNTIPSDASVVNYLPQYSLIEEYKVQADVKIERLEWGKESNKQVKLSVGLKGKDPLFSGNLLYLLKEAKNSDGEYIYKNQEDLDRIYTHPIRFVIEEDEVSANLYVRIFIHKWELITLIPEV